MLIKLVCDSWNHPCLVFDPIRLPSPGGKDNKSNVRRDCHDVVSPTSLNSKQCGSRLALFCHVALDRVETYHRPILINLKRKLQLLRVKHHIRPSKDNSLLIKHSNTMNYWSQADSGNVIFWLRRTNSLFFVGMYTLPQNRFFFSRTQHGSRLILHSDISVGEWKNGRDACLCHSYFFYSPQKEKTLAWPMGKMWYFLLCDTFISSNWCLVWNSQKEA